MSKKIKSKKIFQASGLSQSKEAELFRKAIAYEIETFIANFGMDNPKGNVSLYDYISQKIGNILVCSVLELVKNNEHEAIKILGISIQKLRLLSKNTPQP